MKFTLNRKAGVTWMWMLALMSAPSDGKANRLQKCSLNRAQLSGKRARGDAEGSCCRADLFLGPLVCKAVGETLGARGPGNQQKHLEYIVGSG